MPELYAKKVIMPNVVGMNVDSANRMLVNQGFREAKIHYVESYEGDDMIVQQNPPKGHLVDRRGDIVVYVSKKSLINYLPSVYQATNGLTKENFLKEFLWIFTHLIEGATRKINRINEYFSPLETDVPFLPWLAGWIGVTLDENWDELKKRRVLRDGAQLYGDRGTIACLVTTIKLFTGIDVTVIENEWPYEGFIIAVHSAIGIDTIILPPMNLANCFLVQVPLGEDDISDELLTKIHKVIHEEKPAHTAYYLRFKSPERDEELFHFMRVGAAGATAIGIRAVTDDE